MQGKGLQELKRAICRLECVCVLHVASKSLEAISLSVCMKGVVAAGLLYHSPGHKLDSSPLYVGDCVMSSN